MPSKGGSRTASDTGDATSGPASAVVAAAIGGGAVIACYLVKKRRPSDPSARADRSVNLDVGETVLVKEWNADGTATVKYRGANWTVIQRAGNIPTPGLHRVAELVGSRLLVDKL